MERRSVLKLVALTALSQKLSALPNAAMAPMQDAPPASTGYTLQFFTAEESRLLDQLMEIIIPADDHSPGAHEAATNLFADLMVSTSDAAVKQQWRSGIRLMREAGGASPSQALAIAAVNEENPKTDLERFFVLLKQMTVNGYYTSEIGIHQDMQYVGNAYLGAYPQCAHPEHQQA